MRIRLDDRWVKELLRWPESGMGYQRVDVSFSDGREVEDVPVVQCGGGPFRPGRVSRVSSSRDVQRALSKSATVP